MENKLLYEFAKNFVDEYEKCEREFKEIEDEYYEDNLDWEDDGAEPDYTSCEIYKSGLQAVVVDDFVKQLPPELQSKVILECMKIKTGGSFTF